MIVILITILALVCVVVKSVFVLRVKHLGRGREGVGAFGP